MAKAKKENFAALSADDLKAKVSAEKTRLSRLKFSHAVAQIDNPMEIRKTRKEVARMLTALSAKDKATK